jgi:hypothetical protein
MKTLLLLVFITIAMQAQKQPYIHTFDFSLVGKLPEEVEAICGRGYEESEEGNMLYHSYSSPMLDTMRVQSINYNFRKNALVGQDVIIDYIDENNVRLFYSMKEKLTAKYGKPSKEKKVKQYKTDQELYKAIMQEKTEYAAEWKQGKFTVYLYVSWANPEHTPTLRMIWVKR